ncbi:hypothetical protein M9Y10_011572 [Tritrichomonas musculus]|uniref:Trafficking protein particle complex subunit n=1 Tax=Tritrichomonas musculus TaxID=1915356 RepID=A0ABR2IJU2_9EUKA
MESSPVACISIIAPDGSPIYLRKYQNSQSPSSPQHDDLEIESIIFNALLTIRTQNLFLTIKTLPPPIQSHPIELPSFSRLSVYATKFPLKYTLLVITTRKVIIEPSVRKWSLLIADELFSRIADPFYSPFSPLDKSEVFNANIDKIIRSATV